MTTEITTTVQKVQDYKGPSTFIQKMKEVILKKGSLSPKQEEVVFNILNKEASEKTISMNWPTTGETIIIGRKIGQQLKETYGLQFNPTILDITKVLGISPKAVKFSGKMTVKRGNICMCCGRTLTDEFSMITKLGKTCAKHMKVEYIKNINEVERFRNDYMKRVEEIGEMEFWVPRSQIKKWDGMTEAILRTM